MGAEMRAWSTRSAAGTACATALVALVALVALAACAGSEAPGLNTARNAFIGHDIREARRIYGAIPDSAEPRDRAQARVRLAALDWRFFEDTASAREHLAAGLEIGADSSALLAEWARMDVAAGRYEEAAGRAAEALRAAETEEDRIRAVVRLAEAAVAEAEEAVLEEGRLPDAGETARLEVALGHLRPLVERTPGLLDPSRLQLSVALLLDRGEAAWEAWRSYYLLHLDREGPLPGARDTLAVAFPRWSGPETPPSDRRAVIRSLAASAFHGPALLLASDPRVESAEVRSDPRVRDIAAYARFLREVEEVTDEYYRRTSLGEGDPEAYRAGLLALAGDLWPRLHWEGDRPELTEEAFVSEMRERFGADVNVGHTAGFFDLHLGHVVVDEPRTVDQYGHRAEVRYIALDGMASNGFQSWAWDGAQAHGGWADAETIYQVRPRYAAGPLNVWRALTDPVAGERRRATERADSAADLERARRDPHAYLPGMASRIRGQGILGLRDSLAAAGLEGDSLRAAFLAAYAEATTESSLFAHEGRHAIDRRLGLDLDLEEREYRAKLSEVAFAPLPRLALGAILNPNIGDGTPHGRANLRVMQGLVAWMEEHREAIPGLDPALPLLPQLPLLTDEQLREAFRPMDPLAEGPAGGGR